MPFELKREARREQMNRPCNADRVFEKCYLMMFLRDKGQSGVSIPHPIRLALSSLSLQLGDLDNGLAFIKQIIGGCPDFDEEKTRHYLELDIGKTAPYGCTALSYLVQEHYSDFDPGRCQCKLPPSYDEEGQERKPSPIRFAYAVSEKKTSAVQPANQAGRLVALAKDAEIFHTPDGHVYATFRNGDHRETWSIRSKGFKNWLGYRFYMAMGKPPGSQALQDALGTLEAKGQYDGTERLVFLRTAAMAGNMYIDLANHRWEVIEIAPSSWSVIADPPVRFIRTRNMQPLPHPVEGQLVDLRKYLNLANPDDFRLVVGWLIAAMRGNGPYPVLCLQGEQGSAKSTTSRILKALVDPSISDLKTPPKEQRDLMVLAKNNQVIAFDNLSSLPVWFSDALCRLSTGAGLSCRELYTDDEEYIFRTTTPLIINGIEDIVSRHDLADRTIMIGLASIAEEDRRSETDLWADFERDAPGILGALCDAISEALQNIGNVHLERLPRMADFAQWVVAAEPALPWEPGMFMNTYAKNRQDMITTTIDADPVANSIVGLIADNPGGWESTPTDLLEKLGEYVPDSQKGRSWPKQPNVLTKKLKRATTFLRAMGIDVVFQERSHKGRKITIRKVGKKTVATVTETQQEALHHDSVEERDETIRCGQTVTSSTRGSGSSSQGHSGDDLSGKRDDVKCGDLDTASSDKFFSNPVVTASRDNRDDGGDQIPSESDKDNDPDPMGGLI
jgi:hypothetical protein